MLRLQPARFDPGAELAAFSADRAKSGAIVSFLGLARATGADGPALELECYVPLAERQIGEFIAWTLERFSLEDAAVVHRYGLIAPGEPIVLVMTAARHRRAAFEACDLLMDHLKSAAPFWKREFGPQGARWVEPTSADVADLARWAEPHAAGEGETGR